MKRTHRVFMMKVLLSFVACHLSIVTSIAQPSDSLILHQLQDYGIQFSNDNRVTLLFSGQEKFDDMFEAIRQARHSVHLEYFNFRNDSIASLLFDILKEKRKQGVEIRAIFDGFGNDSNNQPLRKHHIKALRNDSVEIYEFDPIRFPWVNHAFSRDHRKIVVIDGNIAYTGGMNVADYYIKGTEQVGSWRDMHCRVEGSIVNDLQKIFMSTWKKVTGEELADSTYLHANDSVVIAGLKPDTTSTTGHKLVGIINREPRTTNDVMRYFYVHAIDDAQDSIRIINPYFTLTSSVNKALKRAIKRGVKVELMVSTRSDIPLSPDCAFYNLHRLMKLGAHVWLFKPGFHHSKVMMVDGRFCTVCSTNLNARSLRFDYEENAVIIDRPTTLELDQMFDRDKLDSIYLTEETWDEFRTCWQKFRGWFAHLLRPFL